MVGVITGQLKAYIESNIHDAMQNIFTISLLSVRRYIVPLHLGRIASKYYKSIVEGRVEKGENTLSFFHPDGHYCSVQVNYVIQ